MVSSSDIGSNTCRTGSGMALVQEGVVLPLGLMAEKTESESFPEPGSLQLSRFSRSPAVFYTHSLKASKEKKDRDGGSEGVW